MAKSGPTMVRRFLVYVVLCGTPVIALLGGIVWQGYTSAVSHAVEERGQALGARQQALEQIAATVGLQLEVMRQFTQSRLAAPQDAADPAPVATSWIDASAPTAGGAVALAAPGSLDPQAAAELAAIEPLTQIAAGAKSALGYLVWSYYFSDTRRFVLIYPFAPADQMLDPSDPEATLAGYFDYELYKMSQPDSNPEGGAYWTPVYQDAGGLGLMVSHATPVIVEGVHRGMVGTDVLVGFLSGFLAEFPPVGGDVVLLDQSGNVIADPKGIATGSDALTPGAAIFADGVPTDTRGVFEHREGLRLASVRVEGTPWLLVMTIPDAEIGAAIRERLSGLVLLTIGILGSVSLLTLALLAQFVRPAAALADFAGASGEGVEPPAVPRLWTTLRDRVETARTDRDAATQRIRAVIDAAPIRASVSDADFTYRYVNRAFTSFFRMREDQIIGQRIGALFGEAEQRVYSDGAASIAAGKPLSFSDWYTYPDVGQRFVSVTIMAHEVDGRSGYLTFALDLTDLKSSEAEARERLQALTQSEALTRAVVVSSLDGIIVADDHGIVLDFNPAAEAMFGWTRQEAVGRSIGELIVPPEMRQRHEDGMTRYTAGGPAHVLGRRIEIEALRRDRTVFPVELTISEVDGRDGRLFTSHIRDLTAARLLAKEMEEGRQKLQQTEKLSAMGSLLAGVAHEINNPLSIVVAQSTLLAATAADEGSRLRGARIQAAAERCGRIVKSFLAMARQKAPERAPLDVNLLIAQGLEMLGYGLRSSGVEVETIAEQPSLFVTADRDLLMQVICNLILNAQQALTEGPHPRHIRVTAGQIGDDAVLKFEDNGPGVPPELAARIFEPYFTTKAVGVGTGIGLSICRNIVIAHNGRIEVGASPLGGAAFTVTLPIQSAAPAAEAVQALAAASRDRLRALVVDDEPDVAESLIEMLAICGCDAVRVDSAEAALALIKVSPPDLVFTDLRMPGLNGADLVALIVVQAPALIGRVIVVTGDTVAGPGHLARVLGADVPIMEKPFSLDDVRAALARVVPDHV